MEIILSFLLKNWREVAIVVLTLGLAVSWGYDRSSLIKSFDLATERYEKELASVKESHAREVERQQKAIKEYQKKIEDIEKEYASVQQEIESLRDSRVDEVVKLRNDNPRELARQIEEAFGFEYVK